MNLVLGKGLLGSFIEKLSFPDTVVVGRDECDITNVRSIIQAFERYHPDVIINAAGVVPKVQCSPLDLYTTNGLGPRLLAEVCDEYGGKLIHISTDCVYSGGVGNYAEHQLPHPTSDYGLSKLFGEITTFPHLTLRTSFVGYPDINNRGLLAWGASQEDKIIGYDHVYWNGITAVELARLIFDVVIPQSISGLRHVVGPTVTKHEIMEHANRVFGWGLHVVKESALVNKQDIHQSNRTLATRYGSTLVVDTPIKKQLEDMRDLFKPA